MESIEAVLGYATLGEKHQIPVDTNPSTLERS